jgi:dUTP pyrophosphatase
MGVSFPTIKVSLDEGAYMPERAHTTDAGADLRAKEDALVPARGIAFVDTGVHIELPHEMVGSVVPKSGLFRHAGLITHGTIDEGYDGSVGITVANLTDVPYLFHRGDKVAQLVVQRVEYVGFEEADEIKGGERGYDGFGSTGA